MTTEQTCEKIRVMYRAGYSIAELAETFGLREGTIRVIVGDRN